MKSGPALTRCAARPASGSNLRNIAMQLLGLLKLDAFRQSHPELRGPLDVWQAEVETARWTDVQQVKSRYRNVGLPAGNRVVFHLRAGSAKLVVKARFRNGIVLIEWVGLPAEQAGRGSAGGSAEQAGEKSRK